MKRAWLSLTRDHQLLLALLGLGGA
ncbi:MAG: hypothetical protein RLZZ454_1503, partial [Pseudomonadota bacterium]